ncbi:hypothetical protein ABPG74_008514 [Tetrahymena malaccensis]
MKLYTLLGISSILVFAFFSVAAVINTNKSYDDLLNESNISQDQCLNAVVQYLPDAPLQYKVRVQNQCQRPVKGWIQFKQQSEPGFSQVTSNCIEASQSEIVVSSSSIIQNASIILENNC